MNAYAIVSGTVIHIIISTCVGTCSLSKVITIKILDVDQRGASGRTDLSLLMYFPARLNTQTIINCGMPINQLY
jgi:hypothetical protein